LSWVEQKAACERARAVTPEAVFAFRAAPMETRSGAALAATEGLRRAWLAFDLDGVRHFRLALRAVSNDELLLAASDLWVAAAEGRDAGQLAEKVETRASSEGLASLVVETAALGALSAATRGDLEAATRIARRASRMARTEAIPQVEYLAHLVLARVRRLTGAPHLATRILASLRKVAPPPWWPSLAWEAALCGAAPEHGALADWLLALERGDGAAFDARTAKLRAACTWPSHRTDIEPWIAAIDLRSPPTPWSSGSTAVAPAAIDGVLSWRGVAPAGDTAVAYVLADGPIRRRIPRLAFALIDRARIPPLAQSRLKQGRTEMLVAALALAPPAGIDEALCFASVYGFPYEPEVHKSIFDVLVHRAREHLENRGTIARGGGILKLVLDAPLLIADPRCSRPLGDALLGVLAENAGASAKDVAKATGMSLRVVQSTLQSLVKDGACQQERGGREVRYLVEDTTFSEPTQRARIDWG